jgi:hypothetical protein
VLKVEAVVAGREAFGTMVVGLIVVFLGKPLTLRFGSVGEMAQDLALIDYEIVPVPEGEAWQDIHELTPISREKLDKLVSAMRADFARVAAIREMAREGDRQ